MKQRDNEWRQVRLGDVTASRFGDVLSEPSAAGVFTVSGERGAWRVLHKNEIGTIGFTTKAEAEKRKKRLVAEWKQTHWSATAEAYLNEKLAELIHCVPADTWKHEATKWGTVNEPHAFEASMPIIKKRFGQKLSLPVDDFAYIHHPTEPHVGCSPDGIIGDDGLLEIKCPFNGAKWIAAKRKGLTVPREYVPQIQGSLWVTRREWYAFCYFDPRVANSGLDPLLATRVERDDDYIDSVLAPAVLRFRDWLREEYETLIEGGPF